MLQYDSNFDFFLSFFFGIINIKVCRRRFRSATGHTDILNFMPELISLYMYFGHGSIIQECACYLSQVLYISMRYGNIYHLKEKPAPLGLKPSYKILLSSTHFGQHQTHHIEYCLGTDIDFVLLRLKIKHGLRYEIPPQDRQYFANEQINSILPVKNYELFVSKPSKMS